MLGLDAMADEERAKEQLGVVLDSSYFIEYMTVDAVERTSSPNVPAVGPQSVRRISQTVRTRRNKKINDLSRGMQMKLMLAVALSHDAKLLDSRRATSGLDVLSMTSLAGHPVLIMLGRRTQRNLSSTHITADLERCAISRVYNELGMLYYSGPKDEFEDAFRLNTRRSG